MVELREYALKNGIKFTKIAMDLSITPEHLHSNVFKNKHVSDKLKQRIKNYLKQKGVNNNE